MARALPGLVVLLLALGGLPGCGGDSESAERAAGGSQPASPAAPDPRGEGSGALSGAAHAPLELELVWLPGGGLGLANVGSGPATLSRAAQLVRGVDGSAVGAPTPLWLALGCEAARRDPPSTGAAAEDVATNCFTLVPGAALALGGWPDAREECHCPPCLAQPLGHVSLALQGCGGDQRLSLSAPAR